MNKEEWLINEVDKWQDDSLIDAQTGEKIKKQYELYRSFNVNIFAILFAILGATLIIAGSGIALFYSWHKIPGPIKVICAVFPLVISYVLSIYTILFKTENKIWKESVAFLNVVSMFLALGIIVISFHFKMTLSQYLIISSILTIPVLYIMQAVSPLVIYYAAILLWGAINSSFSTAPILLLLFLLGVGLNVFYVRKLNKSLKYNVAICALAGFPFLILFSKMLNGDAVLAAFLYSTLLFAARDVKRQYFPFRLIAIVVSIFAIVYTTTSQAWIAIDGKYGGISLGILTGLILLGSLALEVFNTKDNTYEFSYLLILMVVSIIRYVWGCVHSNDFIFQMVFMGIGIIIALLVSFGWVSLGKSQKRMSISVIGFMMLGITILIKIFETNLFFLGRALGFLALGCISLILVIFLTKKNADDENNDGLVTDNNEENIESEEISAGESVENNDGGSIDEEDNIIS